MDILETSRLIQRRVGLLETLPSFVLLLFVSTGSAICVVIAFLGDDLWRTILWTTSVMAGALVLFRLADAIVRKRCSQATAAQGMSLPTLFAG
jgi:hypothetical protein